MNPMCIQFERMLQDVVNFALVFDMYACTRVHVNEGFLYCDCIQWRTFDDQSAMLRIHGISISVQYQLMT